MLLRRVREAASVERLRKFSPLKGKMLEKADADIRNGT